MFISGRHLRKQVLSILFDNFHQLTDNVNNTNWGLVMMRKHILLLIVAMFLVACGSNEDSLDLGKPKDVKNDTTDNWKQIVTSKKFDVEEDSINYYDEYMEDGEIHYIVSFATNTTTIIRDLDDHLSVDVTEYEDKEEHDAETIGSGMLLKSYNISKDGEVEEVDTE